MKKLRYILGGIAALFVAGAVYAQVTIPYVASLGSADIMQVIKNANPQAGNTYATLTQLQAWLFGGASGHSAVPVLTSCGTGSPTVVGSDYAFTVTQGTTATGCVATFATAWAKTPVCVAVNQTAPGTSTPAYTVTTTAVTLVTASTTGEIWNVICAQQH